MKLIAVTQRLILRELHLSDSDPFYRLNTAPDVLKYTGDRPFTSMEAAAFFLRNYADYHTHGFGRWAVVHRQTGEFLGWCGLKRNEQDLVDIGFRFFQKEWGKGYATEAARASLEIGFKQLKIEEIVGRAATENKASIRVLEKIGMRFWKYDQCHGIEHAAYYKMDKTQYDNKLNFRKNILRNKNE